MAQPDPEDPSQIDEADLWFLPGPPDDTPPPAAPHATPPWPHADRRALIAPQDWRAGEAAQAGALARAAAAFGALDERLRHAPQGWRQRLALTEVAELSWLAGDLIPADRLALWHALRLTGPQDDSLALARAGWALRRLSGGPGPQDGLAGFLGREVAADGALDDLAALIADDAGLHPLTHAGLAFHAGRMLGAPGPAGMIEAAVIAARLGAAQARGGAAFQPLALAGLAGLRSHGSPADRLVAWYAGAQAAALAALMMLDRLDAWQARAVEIVRAFSGRTPPRLLETLAQWPLLSAPMAEAQSGASRAAVQRNLARFEAAGICREVTGQGRFRFWAAAI